MPATARRPRRRYAAVAMVILAACLLAWPVLMVPRLMQLQSPPAQLNEESVDPLESLLAGVLDEVAPLKQQVEAGRIIKGFGSKAATIAGKAAVYGPQVSRSVEEALHGLFLQQLSLLRQQVALKFAKGRSAGETVTKADMMFVEEAESLMLPGSSWDYNPERYTLRASLEGNFRRTASLAEELAQAKYMQDSTKEVISNLQDQMERMQSRLQAMKGGSPPQFSMSYRVPGVGLQLIGRYAQGRGSAEIRLPEDPDPINADVGFVRGLIHKILNLGASLNIVF